MNAKLTLESIWEDSDLFEVKVKASNGTFSGQVTCYTNREMISDLASSLEGFPLNVGQKITFTTGESSKSSFFSLHFNCIDGSGHTVVRVKIAHILTMTNRAQQKYVAEFDLNIEPSAIDTFSRSLSSLAKAQIGQIKAVLDGTA